MFDSEPIRARPLPKKLTQTDKRLYRPRLKRDDYVPIWSLSVTILVALMVSYSKKGQLCLICSAVHPKLLYCSCWLYEQIRTKLERIKIKYELICQNLNRIKTKTTVNHIKSIFILDYKAPYSSTFQSLFCSGSDTIWLRFNPVLVALLGSFILICTIF